MLADVADKTFPNFRRFLMFCNTLQWRLGDRLGGSEFELAVYAFVQGWRFQLPDSMLSTGFHLQHSCQPVLLQTEAVGRGPLVVGRMKPAQRQDLPKGCDFRCRSFSGQHDT